MSHLLQFYDKYFTRWELKARLSWIYENCNMKFKYLSGKRKSQLPILVLFQRTDNKLYT